MSRIKSTDTAPELIVRSALHRLGYRFRIHRTDLPGKPDIVLPRYRVAIFVHGCFWHRHTACRLAYVPTTRSEYWQAKFRANEARDKKVRRLLKALGWRYVTIWECQAAAAATLDATIAKALRP